MTRRFSVASLFLFVFGALSALAQVSGSGTITGTVTDPSGAAVPAASVTVRNTATGIERRIDTNDAGNYVAAFLPPGPYEITASKAGFSNVLRKDVVLQVGQTMALDFAMTVKTSQETVTVTGEAPVVDTEKTDMSQVVVQAAVENLPIAGRRWDSFVLLTPNVTTDGGSGLVSYRGISGLYNSNTVDGANNNQAFFSEARGRALSGAYVYSMDSIQEYQVNSAAYSAELGQAAGGVVNAVTKSGTNVVHGDLFYYLRYPTLNALDPLQKAAGNYTQPVHQQQQFGGSVGGPIVKDRLFFFATYDGSRKVNPISYLSGSRFPQACPSAVTAAQCTAANNYAVSLLGAYPRFSDNDVFFAKLDGQVNSKNHLNASFDFDNFHAPNSYNTAITALNSSLSQNGANVTHERIFVANWDSSITNSTINNFRFQWGRDLEVTAANGTAPAVNVSQVLGYGMPNALPRPAFPDEHRLQFTDVLSSTRGRHTIKAGGDVNRIHELLINLFNGGGTYSYTSFGNWAADVMGVNLGDGLTGRHFSTFIQVTDPVTGVGKDDFYDTDVDFFVEDSWKATSKLTINYGIRYDLQLIPQPPKPNTSTPLTTLYTSTIHIDKKDIAPRLGIAWDLGHKSVLRAGYGIFYGKTTNSTYYATRAENGVIQQSFNCNPTTCPALSFPNLIFTPPGGVPVAPFAGALTPQVVPFNPPTLTQTTRGQSPDFANPRVHEGEVTFEHELPGSIAVSASYVFSRGLRLPMFIDTNLYPSTLTKAYDITSVSGATLSSFTVPLYANNTGPYGTGRIDPTGSILTGFSDVNSWYNSLVLTGRKTMGRGLQFMVNYTLSRATDGGQVPGNGGTFNGTDLALDPYNRKLEYGLSDLNQKHRVVGNIVWFPQFAKKISNSGARLIFDGWSLSSIATVASGQPVTGLINGFTTGVPDGGVTGGLVNNSGTGTGGRIPGPRNSYPGPGLATVDFRLARVFTFHERYKLSLVGEAFNLFNFTNFFSVNTTAYNYAAAGSGACAGHTNACLVANPLFLAPQTSNNNLYGARQLQISGRFTF